MSEVERILTLSALFLSITNAIFILRQFLRDKPILRLRVIYPDDFQWWFEHKIVYHAGAQQIKLGFLVYMSISNKGLRDTTLDLWNLNVKRRDGRKETLNPLSIPQPKQVLTLSSGDIYTRCFRALGLADEKSSEYSSLTSGEALAGWAYYVLSGIEGESDMPAIENDEVRVIFEVKDVFGKGAKQEVLLRKVELEHVKQFIQGIEDLH